MFTEKKSIAMSTKETSNLSEEIRIDDEFILIRFQNDTAENLTYKRQVKTGLIQFHFGLKGKAKFIFNQGNYTLDLMEEKSLLFYNPEKELPLDVVLEPKSWVISILISIKKFHGLFTSDADHIPFLSEQNKDRKYYGEENITPSMAIVLNQMFHYTLNPSIKNLYYKGKGYELLSLFFNKNEDPNAEQCPFLIDEENVQRIKKAKEIIIANMAEPPGLEELAGQVGLNLKKLKAGFKQIYGDTVYGFLFDYKMEFARNLLDSGSYNVNEVGLKIGYSTSSHFIAAFKKKFNTTPKKYLLEKSV